MSPTIRTMAAAGCGALVVAFASLAIRPAPAAGAPADPGVAPHTITVSATGKVTVVPDVARVYLGVTIQKPTVKAARDAAATTMTSILDGLKGLGIDQADLQTSGLSLSPRYDPKSSTKLLGFILSEQLQVTVRDLDKAGDVVDTAMARGATDLNGIGFEVSDPAKALNDARASAVAAARTSGQAMASAAGAALGAVVSIADASAPMPFYYGGAGAAPAADMRTPVQPGTQDVSAAVVVVFELD